MFQATGKKHVTLKRHLNLSRYFYFCNDIQTFKQSRVITTGSFLAYNLRPRRPPFLLVESEGIGVTSSIRPIFMAERASARRADWAPGPGVFVLLPPVARSLMCRAPIPRDLHFSATSCIKNVNTIKPAWCR